MGTIIPFPSPSASRRRAGSKPLAPEQAGHHAQILIFTGVRYSRRGPAPGDGSSTTTRSRTTGKRRSGS